MKFKHLEKIYIFEEINLIYCKLFKLQYPIASALNAKAIDCYHLGFLPRTTHKLTWKRMYFMHIPRIWSSRRI